MDNWADQSTYNCFTCMHYSNHRCRHNAPTMQGFPAVYESDVCGEHKMSKAAMAAEEEEV